MAAPSTLKRHGLLRRFGANFALLLACLMLVAALLATWTQQVLLNTDRFVDVVGSVPSSPAVQASIADFVSTQVVTTLDLQDRIAAVLPPKAAFLAAPITSALEARLNARILSIVSTDQFAQAWTTAQRVLHQELVRVLRGQSTVLTIDQGVLYLNLFPLIGTAVTELQNEGFIPASVTLPDFSGSDPGPIQQQLATTFGVTIPPTFGQFPLVEAAALTKAQTFVKVLDALVIVLWLLVIALMALALWATARRRRMVLLLSLGSIVALLLFRAILTAIEGWLVSNVADAGAAATVQAIMDSVFGNLFSLMWWFVLLAAIVALVTAFGGRARDTARAAAQAAGQRGTSAAGGATGDAAVAAGLEPEAQQPTPEGQQPVAQPAAAPAVAAAAVAAPRSGAARTWIRAHVRELRWVVPGIAVGVIAAIAVGLVTVVLIVAVVLAIEYALSTVAGEDDPTPVPAEEPGPASA